LYSFHFLHRLDFLALAPEFGHGLREQRKNVRTVSKNRHWRRDWLRIAPYSSMARGN